MGEPTYLFLDTEWADVIGSELVSLALVSEDGGHEFYAEREVLPSPATHFVSAAVYPLLDRNGAALSDVAMTTALRRFLSGLREPCVVADYPNDIQLLHYVLAGFDLTNAEIAACGPVPPCVRTCIVRDQKTMAALEDWFSSHPKEAALRHHALVDARALRMAWLVANGRGVPDRETCRGAKR